MILGRKNHFSGKWFFSGEDGIRTHAPVKTNGFQDRPVMTASVPLHIIAAADNISSATNVILPKSYQYVNW